MRLLFGYSEEDLPALLVVNSDSVDVVAFEDRSRECRKADILLERHAVAQVLLHRTLHVSGLRSQLFDVDGFVSALAVAITDIEQQKSRSARHDEHRHGFEQPTHCLPNSHSPRRSGIT